MCMPRKPAKKRDGQKEKVEKAIGFISLGAKLPSVFSFYPVNYITCLYLLRKNNLFIILKTTQQLTLLLHYFCAFFLCFPPSFNPAKHGSTPRNAHGQSSKFPSQKCSTLNGWSRFGGDSWILSYQLFIAGSDLGFSRHVIK